MSISSHRHNEKTKANRRKTGRKVVYLSFRCHRFVLQSSRIVLDFHEYTGGAPEKSWQKSYFCPHLPAGLTRILCRTGRTKKVVILSAPGCVYLSFARLQKEGQKQHNPRELLQKTADKKTSLACQFCRIAAARKDRKSSQKQKFQSKAAEKKSIVRKRRRIADNSGRRKHIFQGRISRINTWKYSRTNVCIRRLQRSRKSYFCPDSSYNCPFLSWIRPVQSYICPDLAMPMQGPDKSKTRLRTK